MIEAPDQDVFWEETMAGRETEDVSRDALIVAGGATNIWRPRAAGEGGVFRGSHAIAPCVDHNWLTLG